MNTININELPSVLLGEIIYRLACYKLIFRCKCVSKRWCTLISEPYFIGRFLHVQIDKQTPTMATLINIRGEELHDRMSSTLSSSMRLTQLLKRLVSFYGLKIEPIVVATYNDLVLCCSPHNNYSNYYICNPHTMQWVALPPPPTQFPVTAKVVGFICSAPYYNYYKEDKGGKRHIIQVNADYECKVVRLLRSYDNPRSFFIENKAEIFSSETGEWRETVVISPISWYHIYSSIAHDGVLYYLCQLSLSRTCLAGLDPFLIINSTSGNSLDYYTCCHVEMDTSVVNGFSGDYCVVSERSLRISYFDWDSFSVYVWDLKEEEEEGHAGKLCYKHTGVYPLDRDIAPEESSVSVFELIAIDPNNDDILYLNINGDLVMSNIQTREWLVLVRKSPVIESHFFQLELPLWPTPIPKLRQHANGGGTSNN